eukprot:gene8354-8538_t
MSGLAACSSKTGVCSAELELERLELLPLQSSKRPCDVGLLRGLVQLLRDDQLHELQQLCLAMAVETSSASTHEAARKISGWQEHLTADTAVSEALRALQGGGLLAGAPHGDDQGLKDDLGQCHASALSAGAEDVMMVDGWM